MEDYADSHAPLSTFCSEPQTSADWQPYALTKTQIEHFEVHGFVGGVRLLDDVQVDQLLDELERMSRTDHPRHELFYEFHRNEAVDPNRVLFHALGAWRVEPGFHDLLWAPSFRLPAYQLLGGPVRQFHDQLFCKPPHAGGVVAWHQDYSYWTWTAPMQHLTCWIALDDVTRENGCLHYVPGSHRWGLLPITGLTGDMDAVRDVLTGEQQEAFNRRVPVELPRGYASFHHPLMMHGSYENDSTRPRRATVLNVVREGVRSTPSALGPDSDFKDFPVLPEGELLDGKFYPRLFGSAAELAAVEGFPLAAG